MSTNSKDILKISKYKIQKKLEHAKKRKKTTREKLDKLEKDELDGKIRLTKYAYFDFLYWDFKVNFCEELLEGDYEIEQ